MSLFLSNIINELKIGEADSNPQSTEDNTEEDETYSLDTETEDTSPEEDTGDEDDEEDTGEDDEYTLTDEDDPDEEHSDGTDDEDEGYSLDDNPEDGEESPEEDESSDDEYSLDDNPDDENEEGGDTSDSDTENDSSDSEEDTEDDQVGIAKIEDELFNFLSDDQKAIRELELKNNLSLLYSDILELNNKINLIPKNEENMEILDTVMKSLINLKEYISHYLQYTFNTKGYIENNIVYQKFLVSLTAIRNILSEMSKESNKS